MKKSNRRKASKHDDEDMADLISNLPDHIHLLILSGLPSTEEIIRTSILSRRWRYLWNSIPSLDLVYPGGWKHSRISNYSKFKEFVDWVLLNRCADLDSFRVSISHGYGISTINPWIHATVMRNVKQLDLKFASDWESEEMVMPHCASLEVLSLCCTNRRLIFPRSSGFPSLRVLKLQFVELLDSDSVKDFLENCIMLEDLTLDTCRLDKLDRLCISCPNLKKLKISNGDVRDCIKIYCPKLVFMELIAVTTTQFIVERIDSLKEARIEFMLKDIRGLYPGISHVESLTTTLYILYECIDGARDPALPKLKTLELTTTDDCSAFTFLKFVQILKHCPELESLCLIVQSPYADGPVDPDWRDLGSLEIAETPSVLPSDVKWVESIEINGERPQLDIDWYPEVGEWAVVVATWGDRSVFGFEPQPNDLYI